MPASPSHMSGAPFPIKSENTTSKKCLNAYKDSAEPCNTSITVPSDFMSTLKVFETYVLSEKKTYEKKIDDFHGKMRALEEQLSREIATNAEERKQSKAQFKAERRQLQSRITDLETELKIAQDRIRRLDELRRDADIKNPDSDRSRADQLATKTRAEELDRQLTALRDEYAKSSQMEEEHRTKMEQYVRELMADSQRYQGECHTLTERLDRLTRELEAQKQRGRDLDRQNDHSTQVQEILKQKLANKEQEISTLQQTLDRVTREKKAVTESSGHLQRQKDQLQGELERRQAEISRLKDWIASAKSSTAVDSKQVHNDLVAISKQKENFETSEKKKRDHSGDDKPLEDVNLSLMFKVNKLESIVREQNAKLLAAERASSIGPGSDDVFALIRGRPNDHCDWLEPLVVSDQFLLTAARPPAN